MSEIFDVYNIIFLVAAVLIFLRLRSVLGKRTGSERPPFDPYSIRQDKDQTRASKTSDNVIQMPGNEEKQSSQQNTEELKAQAQTAINQVAPEGSDLHQKLSQILEYEPGFNPKEFLKGAGMAYEMIIVAFAQGDTKALKDLLSEDVYAGFTQAINDRNSRGETVESTFIGIDRSSIQDVQLVDKKTHITVRLTSQLISVTKNSDGQVIDGDPTQVSNVTDIWTFSRVLGSNDPNWKLVATESVG
ncbi:Tim44/TimA family putative adaptor protein [Flexibacterium corallicola]|uniref:Tim44/TimA family putative adaptor protein n=1 Tax=Flexibacterium corallicola TaxID=3037259 RepID=UPI00286F6254|nr:Tim44/TimA family putative adaptor protein [Pseudovibrio sp. M1P-2-3]